MIKHDLILTIVNRGFADEVMSAAKAGVDDALNKILRSR